MTAEKANRPYAGAAALGALRRDWPDTVPSFELVDVPAEPGADPLPPRWTSDSVVGPSELAGRRVALHLFDPDARSPVNALWAARQVEPLAAAIAEIQKRARSVCLLAPDDLPRNLRSRLGRLDAWTRHRPADYPLGAADVVRREAKAEIVLDVAGLLQCLQPDLPVPLAVVDHRSDRVVYAASRGEVSVSMLLQRLAISGEGATLYGGALARTIGINADQALTPSSERVVHLVARPPTVPPEPCIRCGTCVEVCPVRCHPAELLDASAHRDAGRAERFGLHACIDCGLCTGVCPSRLPLHREFASYRRRLARGET